VLGVGLVVSRRARRVLPVRPAQKEKSA
jgi:hypothetical protein